MKMTKKNKIIIVVLSVLILSVGIGIFVSYQEKAEEAKQEELQKLNAEMDAVQKELDSFYTDTSKEFIKGDVTLDRIDNLAKKKTFESEEIDSEIQTVRKMVVLRDEVATLLDDKQALSETVDIEKAEKQAKELRTEKEAFVNEQFKVINEAKSQKKQIQTAIDKVNQLFTTVEKKDVKNDVTWDIYNIAENEVGKIKQEKAKNELTTHLAKVLDKLKKQDEEKAKKEAEQKQQQEVQQQQNNVSKNNSSQSNSYSGNGNERKSQSNNSASSSSRSNENSGSSSSSSNSTTPKKNNSGNSSSNRSSNSSGSSSPSGGSSQNNSGGTKSNNGTVENPNSGGTSIFEGWD